jgi:uncharacterized membrane protein
MLSLFPELLSWSQLSPFLIRITLGLVLLYWAFQALRNSNSGLGKLVGILEGIAAILLIIGMYVQGAALYAAIDLAIRLVGRIMNRSFLTNGINYYLILFVLAVSLLLTGAGLFAFDIAL